MKRIFCVLLSALLLGLFAACGEGEPSSSEAPVHPESEVAAVADTSEPESEPKEPESEPEEEPDEEETPTPDQDLEELYDALAEAAGLSATLEMTMLDLNAGGGITTDNIIEMKAGQSKIGGDSGLVIVLYVENGTADTMVEELEAYRDTLVSGPAYEEFAEAKAATEEARIEAFGNYVVYVAVSADAGVDYTAVDALLALSLFM